MMYNRTVRAISIGALLVPCLFAGLSCSKKPDSAPVEKTHEPSPVVLAGDLLDALDLLIVMNSQDQFNPIRLSPMLQQRLGKYNGKVGFTIDVKGTFEPLLADGAKTVIPESAEFSGTLTGALNADLRILAGEVGVINAEIFVSEGAQAVVNGDWYRYEKGRWVRTKAAPSLREAEEMVRGSNGRTNAQWRDQLTDEQGDTLGTFDGIAALQVTADPETNEQAQQLVHTVLRGVRDKGSTFLPTRRLAASIVEANRSMRVKFRDEFVYKDGKKIEIEIDGQNWAILLDGQALWDERFIDPTTGKPDPSVRYQVFEGIFTKNVSRMVLAYAQATNMIKDDPTLAVKCRGEYTDSAGKSWGLVDGSVAWGLIQDPRTEESTPGIRREITAVVASSGSTSLLTKSQAEQMVRGTVGVRVLYTAGGNATGWAEWDGN